MKNIFLKMTCLWTILFSLTLHAGENEAYLRRVSLLLTGTPPSNADLQPIAKLSSAEFDKYLSIKIDEYMASSLFAEKMRIRLLELFQLKVSSTSFPGMVTNGNVAVGNSTFDHFVLDLVSQDRSWDELLIGKSYRIDPSNPTALSELDFFQDLFEVESLYQSKSAITLEPKSANQLQGVAGVLTTKRFFDRFFNTKLNENRKRSAAIFRVFLCDKMQPVLLLSEAERAKLFAKAINAQAGPMPITSMTDSARHGTDPQCQSCHYKLDPMGKSFQNATNRPNAGVASGSLTFKKENGVLVDIPYQNIHQLAETIVKQEEYASCQVQHFWDWFVGEDTTILDRQNLINKFSSPSIQRKPKEFIKYILLSQRKTKRGLNESDIRFSDVRPLFNRCIGCHTKEITAPMLNNPELWKSDGTDMSLAKAVIDVTDLTERHPGFSWMPPKDAGWSLEGKDREILKAWLKGGAKMDDGQKVYADLAFDKQVVNEVRPKLGQYKGVPTFNNTSSRYMQNFDFFESIKIRFQLDKTFAIYCRLDKNKLNTLGFMDASFGMRLSPTPTISYYQALFDCLKSISSFEFPALSVYPKDQFWEKLSHAQKKEFVVSLSEMILGKNVYSDLVMEKVVNKILISLEKKYPQTNNSVNDIRSVMKAAAGSLVLTGEFLTF